MTHRNARRVGLFLEIEDDGYGTGLPVAQPSWTDALKVRFRKRPKNMMVHMDQDREHFTPWFSKSDTIPGPRMLEVEFECELAGAGAADTPPPWGKILRCCGFAETTVTGVGARVEYTPVTDGESGIMRFWQDGVAYVAKGVRGTAQLVMNAYEVPHLLVKLTGIAQDPQAADWGGNPADPFGVWKQPLLPTTATSVDVKLGCTYSAGALSGGTAYPSLGLSVDIANKVEFIPLLSGEMVAITDRQMTGKAKMMLTPAQEITWRGDIGTSTETSLGWRIGMTAGAKVGFFAANTQRLSPAPEDYKNFLLFATDLTFLARNANGECKIWAA